MRPGSDQIPFPFVGTVVTAVMKSGVIYIGDPVVIGPDPLGQFQKTNIQPIEHKRTQVPACSAGQWANFALKRVRRKKARKSSTEVGHGLPESRSPQRVYRRYYM
jgi:GTPase